MKNGQLVLQPSSSEADIIRDIGRTFPAHVAYQQRHGAGQRSLYNVLKAYAVYDKEVGYVQGMGFVAATALLYMGEEDTFWLLVALLKGAMHTPMEGLYQQVKKEAVVHHGMHRRTPSIMHASIVRACHACCSSCKHPSRTVLHEHCEPCRPSSTVRRRGIARRACSPSPRLSLHGPLQSHHPAAATYRQSRAYTLTHPPWRCGGLATGLASGPTVPVSVRATAAGVLSAAWRPSAKREHPPVHVLLSGAHG